MSLSKKTTFSFVLVSIFTLFGLFLFSSFYKKSQIDNKILTIDSELDYYSDVLDRPIFVNYSSNKKQVEKIFIGESDYLQVIVDDHNKIIGYSITTNNKNSKFSKMLDKEIISVSEYELDLSKPEKCFAQIGNTESSFFAKQYYYGRPGKYLYYLVGYNNSSSQGFMPSIDAESLNNESGEINCNLLSEDINSINTLMVSKIPFSELEFGFGVSNNQLMYIEN